MEVWSSARCACYPAPMPKLLPLLGLLAACSGSPEDSLPESPADSPTDSPPVDSEPQDSEDSAAPAPRLLINEFMASNEFSYVVLGETPDWIELYNPNAEAMSLAGWSLGDDGDPLALDAGLTIDSLGYLLLFADQSPELGGTHLGFSLRSDGEDLALFAPEGWRSDFVRFGAQEPDISAARVQDGDESSGWEFVAGGTPGRSNNR